MNQNQNETQTPPRFRCSTSDCKATVGSSKRREIGFGFIMGPGRACVIDGQTWVADEEFCPECVARKQADEVVRRIQSRYKSSNIPRQYWGMMLEEPAFPESGEDSDQFYARVKAKAREGLSVYGLAPENDAAYQTMLAWRTRGTNKSPEWVMVRGNVGTGKTALLCAKVGDMKPSMAVSATVWFENEADLLAKLKAEMGANREPGTLSYAERIKKHRVLIIDDLGSAGNFTEYGQAVMTELICHYYNTGENQTLWFTTNLTMEEITTRYGHRVADRLAERLGKTGLIDLVGKSWRQQ
jgi:DNA replication protein DnaC